MMHIDTYFALQRGRVRSESPIEQELARKRFDTAKADPEAQWPAAIHAQWRWDKRQKYNPVYGWYRRLGILYE